MSKPDLTDLRSFDTLVAIMDRLRAPDGCPWDREQTVDTLRKYFMEETYEALEAADQKDYPHLAEELGDVLLEVVFMAKVCEQDDRFKIGDAIESINRKLIRRHPHIFGDAVAADADAVLRQWHMIKLQEKGPKTVKSSLEGIPSSLPALLKAFRLSERVSKVGFDWRNLSEVMDKYQEEWGEFQEALASKDEKSIVHELGDLLLTLVNVGRFLNICAEDALREANERFVRRFSKVEDELKSQGTEIHDAGLDKMEAVWQKVKEEE